MGIRSPASLAREHPNAHLITVGNGALESGGLPHTHLGPIYSDLLLTYFYSACDWFVCPSLQDNLPNTVIESMACGTPVVGYEIGGLPDMVHDHSGLLVPYTDEGDSLLVALRQCCLTRRNTRDAVRGQAIAEYSLATQAERYMGIYQPDRKKMRPGLR